MGLETLAIIGLGLAAGGTVVSTIGALQNQAAMARAERANRRAQEIASARERTKQVREARITAARIAQSAIAQGVQESSGAKGGLFSLQSQRNANLSYINQQELISQALSKARQQQINSQGLVTLGEGTAKIGGTIFGNREEINDIFTK